MKKKKMPTPRHKLIHNPIPTSLFLSSPQCISIQCEDAFSLPNAFTTNKQNSEQRCRDGVTNKFVSWCRHLLVSFLFHALTSLHLPSFIEMIFPLVFIIIIIIFLSKPAISLPEQASPEPNVSTVDGGVHGHQAFVCPSPYIPMVDRGALHGQTLNDAIYVWVHVCWLSACACACIKFRWARRQFLLGLCPKINEKLIEQVEKSFL